MFRKILVSSVLIGTIVISGCDDSNNKTKAAENLAETHRVEAEILKAQITQQELKAQKSEKVYQQQLVDNVAIVKNLFSKAFDPLNVDEVDNYYHDNYIQHTPNIAPGKAGIKSTITAMKEQNIVFNREYSRIIAEGDLVFTQARVVLDIGGNLIPASIVGDLFRIKDGKVIEHWDATQAEVAVTESGRTMIDGGGDTTKTMTKGALARNKKTIADFINLGFAKGDTVALEALFGDEYLQHNPFVPDGKDVVLGFIPEGGFPAEIRYVAAQGDLVVAFLHYPTTNDDGSQGLGNATFDIFRLDDNGKVVEHWDIGEEIQLSTEHANGVF